MRARRTAGLAMAAVLAIAAPALASCSTSSSAESGTGAGTGFVAGDGSITLVDAASRQPAPEISGPTLDGGEFSLAEARGDVVVLNVWASWCAPCRAEAPTLERVARDLADDGVRFIGLNTRDAESAARAFEERFGITYPSVIDRDGRLQLRFGDSLPPQAIPSTLVIDQEGRVAGRILGKASESDLRGLIEPLLESANSSGSAP